MNLRLQRLVQSYDATIGELYTNDLWQCWTLEDQIIEGPKVLGKTAIPPGKYEVIINWSQRFGRLMPLLLNVPQFEGIRIHSGNTAEDTEGCILVGQQRIGNNRIGLSRVAYKEVFQILQTAAKKEKIFIEISNAEKKDPTVV